VRNRIQDVNRVGTYRAIKVSFLDPFDNLFFW